MVITGTVKTDITVAVTAISNVSARSPLAAVTYKTIYETSLSIVNNKIYRLYNKVHSFSFEAAEI